MRLPAAVTTYSLLVLLSLLGAIACSDDPSDTGAQPGQAGRDVSDFLPGHGPGAPAWPPPESQAGDAAPKSASPLPVPPAATPPAGGAIRGEIRIAEGVTAPPGGTLYVIAKMTRSKKAPPIAVKRIGFPKFPMAYTLSGNDAMIPGMPFTGKINITARLDSDGNASTREPTDLEGSYAGNPATVGQSDVNIELKAPEGPSS